MIYLPLSLEFQLSDGHPQIMGLASLRESIFFLLMQMSSSHQGFFKVFLRELKGPERMWHLVSSCQEAHYFEIS